MNLKCPICGEEMTRKPNPNPGSTMDVFSCYSTGEEYFEGPVDLYECPNCKMQLFAKFSKQLKSFNKRVKSRLKGKGE